ncbi:branched-chain amino acid ABC transporter permease [Bosea sp. (in: a-proteobacteria)]|uniref:branched-chain amino acid ABC transporter permease n=1 Tax=Bosea sp. (in: a-proteobacteria) TaxID=1871050 RepID=UPI001ACBD572|nr:branched-chain amino acid ABC transporter permease [Bosea sp. (in: a-proteobacteria)]MBN9438286.1 branched-chain amino acid ABC transporter permease [Bosea sp. (in: a-proteobacteria)]
MLYREERQRRTSYKADLAIFRWKEDRIGMLCIVLAAFAVVPFVAPPFVLQSILIPFLVYALAAIGLNVLLGYAGLVSLGTGAFMGVGAFACYKLTTIFPDVSIVIWILASGLFSAAIGVLFGLPSLRIKGFYLAVATLGAQFFLQWCFVRVPWLYNYNASGAIEVPERTVLGIVVTGGNASVEARYLLLLAIVVVLTVLASNLIHSRIGRSWMALRDMDIAAELVGVRLMPSKLLAFAVSSFYCGVAGAVMMFLYYGGGEANDAFNVHQSFLVLFMVIIGGLGSLIGSYLGAFFISALPTVLKFGLPALGIPLSGAAAENLTFIVIGTLIITFLMVEPLGLARLWQVFKRKLTTWPFPY